MTLQKLKPIIRNVVCTAALDQKINVAKFTELACGIYDEAIYGGRCGYIKTPEMEGRVTIFPSGKMISIGGQSVKKAINQLNHAKFFLVQEKLIEDIKLKPQVQNIVSTMDFGEKIPVDILSRKILGAVYDPETFPGLILKGSESCNFLIFNSGKIVCTGGKSLKEVSTECIDLITKLKKYL